MFCSPLRLRATWRTALPALAVVLAASLPAAAQSGLPEPYVSPALDAVLMPITPAVKSQFKLPKAATGVVVTSVQPGGIGELYGLEPGEVISRVDRKLIRRPIDLDSIVGYGVDNGESYFFFEGLKKGRKKITIAQIDDAGFRAPVSFDQVSRWPGYRARGFDYVRWYQPYAPRVRTVWDDAFAYIGAIIVTEAFLSALRSDQAVFYYVDDSYVWSYDEYYITEVDQVFYSTYSEEVYSYTETTYESYYSETYSETYTEEAYYEEETDTTSIEDASLSDGGLSDDTSLDPATEGDDGLDGGDAADEGAGYDEGLTDSEACDPSVVDADGLPLDPNCADPGDPAYDDQTAYDDPGNPDASSDAAAYDDQSYDDPAADGEVYEDQGYDDPAAGGDGYDDQGYDDPTADGQAYDDQSYDDAPPEEPVYDEQTYDDPAYDDGGAEECPLDEDGNPLCE